MIKSHDQIDVTLFAKRKGFAPKNENNVFCSFNNKVGMEVLEYTKILHPKLN